MKCVQTYARSIFATMARPNHPKAWINRHQLNVIGTLALLGLLMSTGLAQPSVHRHPIKLAQITPQSVYAPLASLDDSAQAELLLNNVAPREVDVRYTIYSLSGEILVINSLKLEPTEIRYTRIADLLKPGGESHRRDLGGIMLDYQGRSMGVLAQITYLGEKRNSIDGIFFFAMDLPSDSQNATWSAPSGSHSTLVLGNSSGTSLTAKLSLNGQGEKTIQLAAHATTLVRVDDSHGHHGAQTATVSYDGPMGALKEAGFVIGDHGYAAPIRFYDREEATTANLFATDLPVKDASSTVTLFNTSTSKLTVNPVVLPIDATDTTPIRLNSIKLEAGATATVTLSDLEEKLKKIGANSVSLKIESDGSPGDIIGSLVSVQDGENAVVAEVPLRAVTMPGQSTGSYPLRLDSDYSDVVTITNVGTESKLFFAHILLPLGKYVFAPRSLAPGETARFDINEIRDRQLKDTFGVTLPRNLQSAKFVWSISTPWGNARMMGRNYVRSAANRVSASFSCGNCCPSVTQGPFVDNEPEGLMVVGDLMSGNIWDEVNDCEGNETNYPTSLGASFDAANVCSYSEGTGTYSMSAIGSGLTNLSYEFFWAALAADSQDCFLEDQGEDPVTDPNIVKPTITGISPAQGLVGTPISVTIMGTGFVVGATTINAGSNISVSGVTVQSATQMTATFTPANAQFAAGNQSVKVTANSQTSDNSQNFFVQIPTHFVRFNLVPEAPNGLGPVITLTDGTVFNLSGAAKSPPHQCGVYENFVFQLMDQQTTPTPITNGTVTVTEVFSNIVGGAGPTPSITPLDLTTEGQQDTQAFTFTLPDCVMLNENESLDMTWTIAVGQSPNQSIYDPTTSVHITKGNFSGTLNVTSTITTP